MKLTEQDGKMLLEQSGLSIPYGFLIPFDAMDYPFLDHPWNGPAYLKAQVLQGRRGSRGLVRRCASPEDVRQYLADMHQMLSSETCAGFLCELEQAHDREWFVSCDIDRVTGLFRFHVSEDGGKEVVQTKTWMLDEEGRKTLPIQFAPLSELLERALTTLDALSIEINPCTILPDGSWLALDAKIELDDAAAFRHPEWDRFSMLSRWGDLYGPREKAYVDLLKRQGTRTASLGTYVELDGDIAMVLSGGGASLVAMDSLIQAGGRPGNYLEISGNPDPEFLKQAASIVFSRPDIRAVWIAGSFANFTDIQLTVRATLEAIESSGLRVPIFIRRDGPQVVEAQEEALVWAKRYDVPLEFDRADHSLSDSAHRLMQKISSYAVETISI